MPVLDDRDRKRCLGFLTIQPGLICTPQAQRELSFHDAVENILEECPDVVLWLLFPHKGTCIYTCTHTHSHTQSKNRSLSTWYYSPVLQCFPTPLGLNSSCQEELHGHRQALSPALHREHQSLPLSRLAPSVFIWTL